MKNVTITLPDDLARQARIEAAKQDKSLSRFIADLLAERCGSADRLAELEKFLSGPGYPGISKAWPGREALYAEREAELLRRYKPAGLRRRSVSGDEAGARGGFTEAGDQEPYTGVKPTKPKRVLPRRRP